MTAPAIAVRDLVKSYGPKGLTFSVPRGAISGFVGPNGAGKTTTLRILMGLAHKASGTADVLGTPAGSTHEIFAQATGNPRKEYKAEREGEFFDTTNPLATMSFTKDAGGTIVGLVLHPPGLDLPGQRVP